MKPVISEDTLIPLSAAVLVLGGGAAWLTALHLNVSSAMDEIIKIQSEQKDSAKESKKVVESLARIEGRLEELTRVIRKDR